MKRIVVLGANGQLGQTIKSLSSELNYEFSFFSREDVDITDKSSLLTTFKTLEFDYCINCAAYTNVENAEKNIKKSFLVNAEGVKNIAEACSLNNVKLIHISTDYVFDGQNGIPYLSSDRPNPINEYGKSKLKGDVYIKELLKEHYIIRTSWLYSLIEKNFLKTIIQKIENNETLTITTEEEGTPTSCIDLSEFIFHIIKDDTVPYGTYNFSANGSTTWYGFAREIVKCLSPKRVSNIIPVDEFKTIAKRPKFSVLDIRETENRYIEIPNWKKSVKNIIEIYKNKIKTSITE